MNQFDRMVYLSDACILLCESLCVCTSRCVSLCVCPSRCVSLCVCTSRCVSLCVYLSLALSIVAMLQSNGISSGCHHTAKRVYRLVEFARSCSNGRQSTNNESQLITNASQRTDNERESTSLLLQVRKLLAANWDYDRQQPLDTDSYGSYEIHNDKLAEALMSRSRV